jgi:tripartite-type tricarboxylate transporter receptor subunit TctC
MKFWPAIAFSLLAMASAAHAENFYKGNQIRLIAGFPAGNDYDLGARLLVKYLPKYIPGQPTIIVQNMPQAASVVAANYLYMQAPRDGTTFGSFSRNIVNDALTGQANIVIDPRKVNWLGATSRPSRVCVRWYTAPVKTPADLFTQEFIVGAAGATRWRFCRPC